MKYLLVSFSFSAVRAGYGSNHLSISGYGSEIFFDTVALHRPFFLVNLFFVGQKGDTGENSTAEIANLEKAATDIQRKTTEIFGKADCFSPARVRRVIRDELC